MYKLDMQDIYQANKLSNDNGTFLQLCIFPIIKIKADK